jgi:hypothetical protein
MKIKIKISGQIGGNSELLRKLNSGDYSKGMFNSFYIEYQSMKEAKKAMNEAYKSLKQECRESQVPLPSISKDKKYLSYDASNAEILDNNK